MLSEQKLTRLQFISSATTMATLPLIGQAMNPASASDSNEKYDTTVVKV